MDKNSEANEGQNEKRDSRNEKMALENQRLAAAHYQADLRNETVRQAEINGQQNAQLESARRLTPDELAKMKIESEQKGAGHSSQERLEKSPIEAALIKKLNETPESEKRAWEKAQLDRVRRLTPDELAMLKTAENEEASFDRKDTIFEQRPEHLRLASAVESIKGIDDLRPERWRELSMQRRTIALRHAGDALQDAYECPDPPLMPRDFPEYDAKILLGFYQDGATLENLKGEYDLSLNEKLLHNDDPRQALNTYCHEFRHAYQTEMARRYDKVQFRKMVHDVDAAARWNENFRNYNHPSNNFDQYRDQIVERDAREFSEKLVGLIYET